MQIQTFASAQTSHTFLINGYVVDSNNIAIPLATVYIVDNDEYTVANSNGLFEIETGSLPITLKISAVGYTTTITTIDSIQKDILRFILNSKQYSLDQVVVTGTVTPTPIDQSIYNISLIDNNAIEQRGALDLGELLATERNIRLESDLILGSQIEMMGISGENVKVLIDGVPIVGRLDGNIDLGQINMENIEQVEIVEGPMSVVYGNNALAGTINLITKKTSPNKLEASIDASAESVNRYSTHVNYMQSINKNTILTNGSYEYFGGVDFDENSRSQDWRPKQMINANSMWQGNYEKWSPRLKFGYFADKLWDMSNITDGYKAFDTYYYTQRIDLSSQVSGIINEKHHINALFAINHYNRLEQDAYKDLRTLETDVSEKESSQKAREIVLRGVHEHTFPVGLKIQTGIDLLHEQMKGPRINNSIQSIADYAFFTNGNQTISNVFDLQIGMRYAYNTEYKTPLVYSLNTKWNLPQNISWRVSLAKGFRAPSIKELHYLFIDSNHFIEGNDQLKPESSNSANTSLEWRARGSKYSWTIKGMGFYNNIENKIDLVQDGSSINYTYENIDRYKTHGMNVDVGMKHRQFSANIGYIFTGRYNEYEETDFIPSTHYTHDFVASGSIKDNWTKGRWSADYKFTGELPYYYTDTESLLIQEGFQASYHILNVNYSRTFFEDFDVNIGLRNLLDVTSLDRSGTTQVGDHSDSGLVAISYGRSAFIKLKYTITK